MKPRRCSHCGTFSIRPPSMLDLQAPVCCEQCGANHGSWRSVENPAADTSTGPTSDLRSSRRSRSLLQGKVVFNNRSSTLDCTLRDSSETGARLTFSAHVPIPDEFDLEIPLRGRMHRVRVMWRRADSCRVQFCDAP
jgi:PilZ domain